MPTSPRNVGQTVTTTQRERHHVPEMGRLQVSWTLASQAVVGDPGAGLSESLIGRVRLREKRASGPRPGQP
jgi:hypothetical protein